MKRTRFSITGVAVVIVGILVLIVATSGGSAKNRTSVKPASALSVKTTSLGKTLVDANGRTLYLFAGDKPNISTLSAAGLAVWPPFSSAGTLRAEGGVQAAQIGTTTGPSGAKQLTYNGHPLYYYVGDQQPGSTRGQRLNEFGALWYALTPSGNAITTAPSKSQPASSPAPATSGGYGY